MNKRMFWGIDLNENYGSLLWNAGDPVNRRRLALCRQFKGYCLQLERELKKGMYVIDKDNRLYQIVDIEGYTIEDKLYWVQRFTSYKLEKKTALDIYPLDLWTKERERIREGTVRCPFWFQVVEAVKRMEERQ